VYLNRSSLLTEPVKVSII